ncbi:hypothetical protein C5167_048975, partial [Papaver somniferum]
RFNSGSTQNFCLADLTQGQLNNIWSGKLYERCMCNSAYNFPVYNRYLVDLAKLRISASSCSSSTGS